MNANIAAFKEMFKAIVALPLLIFVRNPTIRHLAFAGARQVILHPKRAANFRTQFDARKKRLAELTEARKQREAVKS